MTREEWLESFARKMGEGEPSVLQYRLVQKHLADALELAGVFEPRPAITGMNYIAGDDIGRGDIVRLDFYGQVWSQPNVAVREGRCYLARSSAKRSETVVVDEMWEKTEVTTERTR